MSDSLLKLQEDLRYTFVSVELLRHALTHRSAASQRHNGDYERLEFLGDAVFDLVVADLLLQAHPLAREGELSKMRAALVNTISLATLAEGLQLSNSIQVSRAERSQNGHKRPAILADVMESLIGAIYREAGFLRAKEVIAGLFGEKILSVDPTDPKTELQEALHTLGSESPEYLLEAVEGPEHAPTFVSVVSIDGTLMGRGEGNTKKGSQQQAAQKALHKIREQESDKKQDEEDHE